ncbi:helix-turn-helix domain-containing protein [Halobacillus hunanensis]|uniref:helix-turn-helix domain-containing protein n=1 Tax=Halobacillus hunanensis TaxID=578214 RepID=UPI0015921F65|nr:helix-turn-helix domain-containing protein [Halobacillus hunanensis]
MDPYVELSIGSTIKDLRLYLGISQKELSDGICTQSLISQIESGTNIPNSILLRQVAEKLGITLDGLLLMSEYPKFPHFKKIESKLIKLVETSNYTEAWKIIELEKGNTSFESGKVKQFFLWAEGVCQYYLSNDFTLAMDLLKEALNISDNLIFSYQDVKILNSQGILYAEENLLEESIETFKLILATKEKLSPYVLSISSLFPKVYYNLSKVLTIQGSYEESIKYCQEGIYYSGNMESISDLGELYFQIGLNFEKMQKYNQSLKWLIKSQDIFKLKVSNYEFLMIITNKIQEVSLLLEKDTK